MNKIITREYLIELLNFWQDNKISAVEIFEIVNQLYFLNDIKFNDWDDKDNSVSNIVMQQLDCLDIDLVTEDDIEQLKKFLSSKKEDFQKGLCDWQNYLSKVDYNKRRIELRNVLPYSIILN